MEKLFFYTVMIFASLGYSSSYANEWVSYIPVQTNHIVTQTVVPYPIVQQQIRAPVLVYELTPYYFYRAIVSERFGIFCQQKTVSYEPSVVWIYQPVWR